MRYKKCGSTMSDLRCQSPRADAEVMRYDHRRKGEA